MMKSFFFKNKESKKQDSSNSTKTNAEAQYKLGLKYAANNDMSTAFDWFTKASEIGHGAAQNRLGLAYQYGLGIPQDYGRAYDWFLEASTTHNNSEAQFHLGSFYYYGLGVTQDYMLAYQWFLKSSESGCNSNAQNSIGFLYQRGWGVQQDYKLALKWFLKSAANNNCHAQNQIGVFYKKGYGVKVNHRTALDWYMKSAKNGSVAGQCNTAWMYYDGNGTKQDYGKALTWFLKAADEGNSPDAQLQIGVMYFHGYGVPKDFNTAIKFLDVAIENGNTAAKGYKDKILSSFDSEKIQVSSNNEEGVYRQPQYRVALPPLPPAHHEYSTVQYRHSRNLSQEDPRHHQQYPLHKKAMSLNANYYATRGDQYSNNSSNNSSHINLVQQKHLSDVFYISGNSSSTINIGGMEYSSSRQ